MYIYESHLGGIYFSEEELDDEFLYCDQCGDDDWEIGEADTYEEAKSLIIEHYKSYGYEDDEIDENTNKKLKEWFNIKGD